MEYTVNWFSLLKNKKYKTTNSIFSMSGILFDKNTPIIGNKTNSKPKSPKEASKNPMVDVDASIKSGAIK